RRALSVNLSNTKSLPFWGRGGSHHSHHISGLRRLRGGAEGRFQPVDLDFCSDHGTNGPTAAPVTSARRWGRLEGFPKGVNARAARKVPASVPRREGLGATLLESGPQSIGGHRGGPGGPFVRRRPSFPWSRA